MLEACWSIDDVGASGCGKYVLFPLIMIPCCILVIPQLCHILTNANEIIIDRSLSFINE